MEVTPNIESNHSLSLGQKELKMRDQLAALWVVIQAYWLPL
jgi:hypothetical protein